MEFFLPLVRFIANGIGILVKPFGVWTLNLTSKLYFLRRGRVVLSSALSSISGFLKSGISESEIQFVEPSIHCLNICPAGSTPVPFNNDILVWSNLTPTFGSVLTENRSNQPSPIMMKAVQNRIIPIVAFLHLKIWFRSKLKLRSKAYLGSQIDWVQVFHF